MNEPTRLLAQVPLFTSLPDDELEHLAASLRLLEIPSQTVIFHEGEQGGHLYIVREGALEVVKALGTPDERLIGVRGPGEFVGEAALFNPDGQRTASVRTREASRVWEMTRADFSAVLERQPTVTYQIVRVLSQRLNASHNNALRDLQEKNRRLSEAYEELKAAQAQIIEKERLERELKVAQEIQMSILPRTLPRLSGFDFGAQLVPARWVGGDFYDFIPLDDHTLGVMVGDVTDKGVPAAIFMAQTRALLRAEAVRAGSPRDVLQRVNQHLLDMNQQGLFATVLYGVLEAVRGEFSYARAGHEPPMLCDADGALLPLNRGGGQPLGILDEPLLDEQRVSIPRGGTLLLYTDGVTESRNEQRAIWGEARLGAALRAQVGAPAQEVCDKLLEAVLTHQGRASQFDDVTLVAIHAER
jgi:serine phosphatase RsbU (regulator of sigma subunit)